MSVEAINAKYYDIEGIADKIGEVMSEYAEKAEKDFDEVTETWDHDIDFQREGKQIGSRFETEVFTNSDIFRFVNDGTAVRYATMTKDFRPKTKPGVLSSNTGQGGLLFVSKQNPRPGIKPRNFTKAIIDKHGKDFINDIQRASADGAQLRILKLITSVSRALSRIRRML